MLQNKQKKKQSKASSIHIEGVAKKITKKFQKIIEEFQQNFRIKEEQKRKDYDKLCEIIQQMAFSVNQCYRLFIGDQQELVVNHRNPFLLVKYTQLFLTSLVDIKKSEMQERQNKKAQNDKLVTTYNQNNVYELLAKKNIQFLQMQTQISQLQSKVQLATERAVVAEQMTENIKQSSDQMLKVYRDNFVKMSDFLKNAQQKQTKLVQANRLLTEQMQTLNLQFDIYKKNFKKRSGSSGKEQRLRQMLQKQYEEKLAQVTKQLQYQYKVSKIR